MDTTTKTEALVVTPEKAAAMLDCSRSKIYALVKAGSLKAIKLSPGKKGGLRILTDSILAFVSEGEIAPRDLTPSEILAGQRSRAKGAALDW
jgi:excisionase family DNA binding protein